MKRPNVEVAFLLVALSTLLWRSAVEALGVAEIESAEALPDLKVVKPSTAEDNVDPAVDVCSSLTGPFCAHTDSMALYASYMTPISVLYVQQEGNEVARRSMKTDEEMQQKKCFFQHFTSSWMDAGGDVNDLMNQQVANVDECEQLCCEHAECQSFTFWRGHTCFLRATSKTPRPNGESFSGIRLI